MRALPLIAAASLAACAPEEKAGPEPAPGSEMALPAAAEIPAGSSLPAPPAPPPAAPALPGLSPLSEEELAAELAPGARCRLRDGGRLLLAATTGGAIVKERGRIVHLRPQAYGREALAEGGTFVAGALKIKIDAGAVTGRSAGSVERDTSVDIVRGRRGYSVSHGPRWTCGS